MIPLSKLPKGNIQITVRYYSNIFQIVKVIILENLKYLKLGANLFYITIINYRF